MKKMKKILAALLAFAMVLGMSMTTMAAEEETGSNVPKATDEATATVLGVEAGATVTAYQIVKGNYNDNGLIGYEVANEDLPTGLNVTNPAYEQVMAIAAMISGGEVELETIKLDKSTGTDDITYTGELTAGYWIVLVKGTGSTIYNPMLIGVSYKIVDGNDQLTAESVNAGDKWRLSATETVAKSSTITIDKTADVETQHTGGDVNFTVTTQVPDYSDAYQNVTFKVTDTLKNLELNAESIKVYIGKTELSEVDENEYELDTAGKAAFTIDFNSDWILNNGNQDITIKYTAILTKDAVNEIAGENCVKLEFTNNPGETGKSEDIEKVYSFELDVFKKVGEEKDEDGNVIPLIGAEFTLYTDKDCTKMYTNGQFTGTATSDEYGKFVIKGLDVGTYYFKETKAPTGYTINTTVYKVDITSEIDVEELTGWTVKVTPLKDGTETTEYVTFTYSVGTDGTVTKAGIVGETGENEVRTDNVEIPNTKLIGLPSTGGMGTTIFTIAGCAIMIAAAFLFFTSRRKENK